MTSRVVAGMLAGVVAAVLAVGLAGCSGAAPKASPSPTPPFASADAAYEAAEATYRGYVDAGNHVDLADDKTFEPVYSWLLGDALDHQRKEFTAMAARDFRMSSEDRVTLVAPAGGSDPRWGDVVIAACVDVSGSDVVDASGNSLVQGSRPDEQSLKIAFSRDGKSATGMKITSITGRKGSPKCGG